MAAPCPPAPRPVFISYARFGSPEAAHGLHDLLSDDVAFLDTHGIEHGDSIPGTVLRALLDARLLVAFIDPVYFTRRYCWEELDVALRAYRVLSTRRANDASLDEALLPVVIVLAGAGEAELDFLPPDLRTKKWPTAEDGAALRELVTDQLRLLDRSIGERLDGLGALDGLREELAG